jgi:hypothetical protein
VIVKSMSLESWKSCFEWGGVVAVLASFLFGAGAIIFNNRINRIQAQELRNFQLKMEQEHQNTARAQQHAAEAQRALAQYVDVVAKSGNPRHIDFKRFVELLQGKQKGSAEIWYRPDDDEAREFAFQIYGGLGPTGAGWSVTEPKSSSGKLVNKNRHVVEAAKNGVVIISKHSSDDLDSLQQTLRNAIELATGGWGIAGLEWLFEDSTLPENHFVIIIGHHQVNAPLVRFDTPKP